MKFLVSALEPSANVHLATFLEQYSNAKLRGVFEPFLGTPDINASEFAVMGFLDVISKILLAKRAIKQMVKIAKECNEAILVDAPAFNVPLAKALKKANPNFKITYYILPKVWAWKAGRIKTVNEFTDIQAYIFPFEKIYWQNGVYVGNPLLKQITNFKTGVNLSGSTAFLAGSRSGEIKRLMPLFKEIASLIEGKKTIAIPPHFSAEKIKNLYGDLSAFEIARDAKKALFEAGQAVVCSGTATLESALIGTPFVLVYKAPKIDEFIVKRFVKLKYAGLANILFDFENKEIMHAELIQESANVGSVLEELGKIDPQAFLKKSFELRDMLSV